MTTILKALQEIERTKSSGEVLAVAPMARQWRPRWVVSSMIVLLVVMAAAATRMFRSGVPQNEPGNVAGVAPDVPQVPRAVPGRAPTRVQAGNGEVPWGRVQQKLPPSTGEADEPGPSRRSGALAARPQPAAAERPKPRRVERSQPQSAEPAEPADAPRAAASGAAPRIEVSAIAYSPDIAKRSVTLRIDGGPATTLHEGESVSGVDVQLILSGSVYVRHGGNIISVERSR